MIIAGGQVAVVTGAASGIGLALCRALAARDVSVVMADVNADVLADAAGAIQRESSAQVLPIQTDVSKWEQVEQLAERTYERFGATHLLINNAGVIPPHRPVWEAEIEDWRWVIEVDLFGVVHGIKAFVPKMIAGHKPGHVVNTASIAGLLSYPAVAPYAAAKHAVVAATEALRDGLSGSQISASVLCPGLVATDLHQSSNRLRPLGEPGPRGDTPPQAAAIQQPDELAATVLDAVQAGAFWILPHDYTEQIEARTTEIVQAHRAIG